jgi:hypothetical protein
MIPDSNERYVTNRNHLSFLSSSSFDGFREGRAFKRPSLEDCDRLIKG